MPTSVRLRACASSSAVDALRQRQPREEPALRRRPVRAVGHLALERGEHALALPAVERRDRVELLVDPAAPHVLLEQPLAEGARALVGRSASPRRARRRPPPAPTAQPEPDAREERLRRRPGLHDHVRRLAPEAPRPPARRSRAHGRRRPRRSGSRSRRASSTSGARRSAARRHAGRVLVVRDRVEQLRRRAAGEHRLELVDAQALLVDRHRRDSGPRSCGTPERAQIRRRFDRRRGRRGRGRLCRAARAPRSPRS